MRTVTLQRVGRTGIADARTRFNEDEVDVLQVPSPEPRTGTGFATVLLNMGTVYSRAITRLARVAMSTPADVVIVGNTALIPLAAAHARRFESRVIVNARERLNGIRTKGSIGTLVSRFEPALIRYLGRDNVTLTTVADGHAEEFRAAGARDVLVVRNMPAQDFVPTGLTPLPDLEQLIVVLLGSLYPGRGVEALIRAVHRARGRGIPVRLEITGRGSDGYLASVQALIGSLDACGYVDLLGPCTPGQVTERYARGHIGTALYEPVDRANDSLSNKLFESVASGRPVLAGNLSENLRVVDRYNLGWTSAVEPDALARTIAQIWTERDSLPDRARHCHDIAARELNWEAECATLISRIRQVLAGRRPHPTTEHRFGHP